jgi:NIMA (never in mitosis gene a)-related kinase
MQKYETKKVVGQGSFGKAILCARRADTKLCIIKQISLAKLSARDAKATELEATLLSKLKHPNIVTFWESFTENHCLHIVMEYADGGDLDHYVKNHIKTSRNKEISEKQVLHLFVQMSLAIKHIHDRKILHRDLKSQVRRNSIYTSHLFVADC